MKKALISPEEKIIDPNTGKPFGARVCDIVETPFEVAPPFYWVDCPDDVAGETHYFFEEIKRFVPLPQAQPTAQPSNTNQPVTQGAQTL